MEKLTSESPIDLIAFYLPQFHPIEENNKWWGPGFTEWTNVAKAKPLYKGHHQPNIPADLGFYDLRVQETRIAQAELAKRFGISAFCYWHYWFRNGKKILERPFSEVLDSKEPDFPFCLAWANESWTGVWHGLEDKILVEQTYPGIEDHKAHFQEVLPAFQDTRYKRILNKPVFIIYRPFEIPNVREFIECWQQLAIQSGLTGIYFIGIHYYFKKSPTEIGLDALVYCNENYLRYNGKQSVFSFVKNRLLGKPRHAYRYKDAMEYFLPKKDLEFDFYPCVLPNWDNSPRLKANATILEGSSPEQYEEALTRSLKFVSDRPREKRIVFVKSWNEWAEGNYLEPDLRWGTRYLEHTRKSMDKFQ
jgi:lipopolysaccharide biosynthesis protein